MSSLVRLFLAALLLPALSSGAGEAPPEPRLVLDRPLPEALRNATDLRWLDEASLLVSEVAAGVYRLPVPEGDSELRGEPFAVDVGGRWGHLGVSSSHLAGGNFAFEAWWWPRDREGEVHPLSVEYLADLDLHGERLLLTGLRRGEDGELGADGAMAWLATLGAGEAELRPVLPLPGGALQQLQDCAMALLPKARFLEDGSFVLVPAVAPGVFLYEPSGKLARTWDTAPAGLDHGCLLSDEQKLRFGGDPALRQGWLNQLRIVDEVLPLPDGPGLLVRSHGDDLTRWELLRLDEEGGVKTVPITVTSRSAGAFARGDVLDDRLALLVVTPAPPGREVPPARLLIYDLVP